ncbi:MAG: hypothetical protein JWO36_2897 [Myxococcales bacterium]|nr:hypothetical protein [Myxococcales bacterium]
MKRIIVVAVLGACDASLDQRLAIVREPRVLAITSEPPEVKPGSDVVYSALVAGPDGPIAASPQWALCNAPKPPTEDNAVSDACLGNAVIDLGAAPTVTATIPADACITFGPDVPPGGFRPRDADPTGGYYQPVRADAELELAFGFSRITCNLPNAPGDVAHAYQLDYVANRNPSVSVAVPSTITRSAAVTLTAEWPPDAAESFLYYDPQTQTLVTRREAMRVSWFASAGAIAVDASAVGETSDATSVTTTWQAPARTGPAWLWIVLRDSRGGIATATIALTIE